MNDVENRLTEGRLETLPLSDSDFILRVGNNIDADTSAMLWRVSQEGFSGLNNESFSRQNMTEEEYYADIENPNVLKFVAYEKQDGEEVPVGLALVHAGLDSIGWVDRDYFIRHAMSLGDQTRVYYISTIVTEENRRGVKVGSRLAKSIERYFYDMSCREGVRAAGYFDFAGANEWLPEFLTSCFKPIKEDDVEVPLGYEELGGHRYVFINLESTEIDRPERLGLDNKVSIKKLVNGQEAEDLKVVYSKLALGVIGQNPEKQTLTQEEVDELLLDEGVYKIISYGDDGRPASIAFLASSLRGIPYLSTQYAERVIGEADSLFWVSAETIIRGSSSEVYLNTGAAIKRLMVESGKGLVVDISDSVGNEELTKVLSIKSEPMVIDWQRTGVIYTPKS